MRWIFAAAALVAVLCFNVPASQAYSGNERWCAVISIGTGAVMEECYYRTVEECVPNVLAGNRGFCNLNPRYVPAAAGPRPHHKRHHKQH